MIKRTIVIITLSLTLSFNAFANEDGPIFDLTGIVKPIEWSQWEESEQHKYLQDRGAYPAHGNNYEGQVDMEYYFENLGITEPLEWYDLTTQERTDFLSMLSEESLQKVEVIEKTKGINIEMPKIENTLSLNPLPIPLWSIVILIFLAVGILGIITLRKKK